MGQWHERRKRVRKGHVDQTRDSPTHSMWEAEFQASLGYKATNRQVGSTQQDPGSEKRRWGQGKRGSDVPREKSRNPYTEVGKLRWAKSGGLS